MKIFATTIAVAMIAVLTATAAAPSVPTWHIGPNAAGKNTLYFYDYNKSQWWEVGPVMPANDPRPERDTDFFGVPKNTQ